MDSVSAQHPGAGEVKSELVFCAAWWVLGRLRGAPCAGLPWIYSSGEVHRANRKEYINLLLKIPRIAKQDLALFFVLFLSFVVRSSLNLLNLDCTKLINQEALL